MLDNRGVCTGRHEKLVPIPEGLMSFIRNQSIDLIIDAQDFREMCSHERCLEAIDCDYTTLVVGDEKIRVCHVECGNGVKENVAVAGEAATLQHLTLFLANTIRVEVYQQDICDRGVVVVSHLQRHGRQLGIGLDSLCKFLSLVFGGVLHLGNSTMTVVAKMFILCTT